MISRTWPIPGDTCGLRQELREDMVRRRGKLERQEKSAMTIGGKEREVKKWLRAGGVWGRGGDVL